MKGRAAGGEEVNPLEVWEARIVCCPDETAATEILEELREAGIQARINDQAEVIGRDGYTITQVAGVKVEVPEQVVDQAWPIVEEASRRIAEVAANDAADSQAQLTPDRRAPHAPGADDVR